jgi:hypothetical protein
MVRLRALSQLRFLHLHKIADLGGAVQNRTGSQMRKGTNHRVIMEFSPSHDAGIQDRHTVTESAVRNPAVGVDHPVLPEPGATFQCDARVNHRVLANLDLCVNEGAFGIAKRDSCGHPASIDPPADDAVGLRELLPGIDPKGLFGVRGRQRRHTLPPLHGRGDNVGQVILLLYVLRPQLIEHLEQEPTVHNIRPGVDLRNGALRSGGIALLDHPHDLTLSSVRPRLRPHDTAISSWIVQLGGQDRDRCAFGLVKFDKPANGGFR